jgi:hypothetical protein
MKGHVDKDFYARHIPGNGAWQAKYDETLYRAKKWGKPAYGRLCDYVRHEVSEMLKRGEEIKP